MPADEVVGAARLGDQQFDVDRAAAQVEPQAPHAPPVQAGDVAVAGVLVELDDAHPPGSEFGQGSDEVGLVRALEGAADHRAAGDIEAGHAGAVVVDGERRWQVAVVLDQREPRIDHMDMGVEHALQHAPPGGVWALPARVWDARHTRCVG